jgi:AAA domain
MTVPVLQREPTVHYLATIERAEEMGRLHDQARRRKSVLIFGPEGVGKTRLLKDFVKTQQLALYVNQTSSPRDLMLALVESLRSADKRELRLPADPKTLSTSSLKGMVQRALDQIPFLLVLDHLAGPSRVLTGMIKEVNYYGRTPVFFGTYTAHGRYRHVTADVRRSVGADGTEKLFGCRGSRVRPKRSREGRALGFQPGRCLAFAC